jgi:hypothetical protein
VFECNHRIAPLAFLNSGQFGYFLTESQNMNSIARFIYAIAALIAAISLLWIAISVSKTSKPITSAVVIDGLRVSVP